MFYPLVPKDIPKTYDDTQLHSRHEYFAGIPLGNYPKIQRNPTLLKVLIHFYGQASPSSSVSNWTFRHQWVNNVTEKSNGSNGFQRYSNAISDAKPQVNGRLSEYRWNVGKNRPREGVHVYMWHHRGHRLVSRHAIRSPTCNVIPQQVP